MIQFVTKSLSKFTQLNKKVEIFQCKEQRHYSQFLGPGNLCFDVGANIGKRTDIYLALGARVVCVEPQPKCVTILTEKYCENSRVVVVPKGVAARPGIMSLWLCESAQTIATFSEKWKTGRFHDSRWESKVDVSVTTLDALVQEFGVPTFCKIDVEGFEYQVLQGLSSPIPALSFEFTKEFLANAKLCMDYLASLGDVEFNYVLGETMALVLPFYAGANTVLRDLHRISDDLLWGDIYVRFR
jgi:FkbM family methyltransferase